MEITTKASPSRETMLEENALQEDGSQSPAQQPHFVVKRGHLGRYRFTLMLADKRLTGEIHIAQNGMTRAQEDQAALEEIRALTEALRIAVESASR